MTAYILTPAQHAQLVDALDFVCRDGEREVPKISLTEALAMLKAMKPVELYGWGADSGIVGDCIGPKDRKRDETEYTIPLYAMETKT